jgi:hypothetical protein
MKCLDVLPCFKGLSKGTFISYENCVYLGGACNVGKTTLASILIGEKISPLLKIEISSNGQNCSILSQKVPKFELYKYNDELFNIYYGIFYEL